MKTVGEILKNKRQEKKLTLEQIEEKVKIRKKFLLALEENNFSKLPSSTYLRGFIKNYSEFLGLDSAHLISIFRRQFADHEKTKLLPQGISTPLNEPFLKITPSKIMAALMATLLFLFFSWLFLQYQSFVNLSKISLDQPKDGQIIKSNKVQVSGETDPSATLTINGQKVELFEGKFNQEIEVEPGVVTIEIVATNRFGKKQEVKRTIRVESP